MKKFMKGGGGGLKSGPKERHGIPNTNDVGPSANRML